MAQITDVELMDELFSVISRFRRQTAGGGPHHGHCRGPEPPNPGEGPAGHRGPGPHGHHGPGGHFFGHMWRDRILAALEQMGTVSQKALAEQLNMRPQSLSHPLQRMEKHELITRETNAQDKRETLVTITDKGRERAAKAQTVRSELAEKFFGTLDDAEKSELYQILKKLADANDDTDAEPATPPA